MLRQMLLASVVSLTVGAGTAIAQDPPAVKSDANPSRTEGRAQADAPPEAPDGDFISAQEPDEWLASRFVGQTVMGTKEEAVGQIEDLLVGANGEVKAAILDVGRVVGTNTHRVAVPVDAITYRKSPYGPQLSLNATTQELQNAPAFVTLEDRSLTDTDRNFEAVKPVPLPQ